MTFRFRSIMMRRREAGALTWVKVARWHQSVTMSTSSERIIGGADEGRSLGRRLTFHVPKPRRRSFEASAVQALSPQLIALYNAARIAAVLPFRHRPVKMDGSEGTPWTDYWVLALAPQTDPQGIGKRLECQQSARRRIRTACSCAQAPPHPAIKVRGGALEPDQGV